MTPRPPEPRGPVKQPGRRHGPPPNADAMRVLARHFSPEPLPFERRMTHYVGSTDVAAWNRLTPKQRRRLARKENHALAPFALVADSLTVSASKPRAYVIRHDVIAR